MAFVNATDSSATSSPSTATVGPISFQDLLSSAFNVGTGNSSTDKKTNQTDQTQRVTEDLPVTAGIGGTFPTVYPTDAMGGDSGVSTQNLLLIGGGLLVVGLLVVLVTRR